MFEFNDQRRYIALWLVRTAEMEWLLAMWTEGGRSKGLMRSRTRTGRGPTTYCIVSPSGGETVEEVERVLDRVNVNMRDKLIAATCDKLVIRASGLDAERAVYGWSKLSLTDPDLYVGEPTARPGAISVPRGLMGRA